MNFELIEKNIGYVFKDKRLLKKALTRKSAGKNYNNETLEFFGDAILEFVVSEKIYDENIAEGELTKKRTAIVKNESLKIVSISLGLDKFLTRGADDDNKSIPSAYEAIVAAIYFDGGLYAAKEFIIKTLDFSVKDDNPIGDLKEWLEDKHKKDVDYSNYKDLGNPQNPQFEVTIIVEGETFVGYGKKKKHAEQNAAKAALEWIKENL